MSNNSAKIGNIMLAPLGAGINKKTKVKVLELNDSNAKVEYVDPVIKQELGNRPITIKKSLLEKIGKIKVGNKIEPERWIGQIMKQFPDFINSTFLPYMVKNKVFKDKKDLTTYQKFIRDYLNLKSPYRGLLLYHGLGSGKTCSSITVAESIGNSVIVLSPATLKSNYITALKEDPVCGVKNYKNSSNKLDEKYTFISYNAPNTIEQLDRISTLDNHVIVIDEIHNLISMMVTKSRKGPEIYKRLMDAKNVKIVALSGTPIINYPYEVALLANILRGYIDVPVFFVKEAKSLDSQIIMLKQKVGELKLVDYVDNNQRYVYIYLKVKPYESEFDEVVKKVIEIAARMSVKLEYLETRKYSLFPEDEEEFREYFIEETQDGEFLKNIDLLKRRMLGLISYYRGGKPEFYPRVNPVNFIEVPMSEYQFSLAPFSYKAVRDIERDKEKAGAVQKLLGKVASTKSKNSTLKKVSSLFKVFSRQFSNFVFPAEIERPFVKKFIDTAKMKKLEKKSKKSNNALEELEKLQMENKQTEDGNFNPKDRVLIDRAMKELDKNKEEYLRDTPDGLQRYSPKMAKMLEYLDKSPGKAIVYSTFRSMEGIGIFELVLQANGWQKVDVERPEKSAGALNYAIYSGVEDEAYKEKVIKIYNDPENRYGDLLKCLMISASGAEGLDLKATRQVHIMEPYWHDVRTDQVIGRANRLNSHIDLPEKDRTVDIYRYITTLPNDVEYEEKESTDQYIYGIAVKKMKVTDEIKKTMKEIAVDCVLNAVDNERDIKCFSFGLDARGLAYKADIKEDYVYGKTEIGTKEVTKKLEPMFLDDENNLIWADKKKKLLCYFNNKECKKPLSKPPKSIRKVGVDMKTNEVFDVAGIGYGNLVKLGIVDESGKLV